MLVGNCSLSLYPVTDATRGEVSDLFAYIEDVPRHLFDDAVPWTWSDYAGYRDVVNATGTGINLAGLVVPALVRRATRLHGHRPVSGRRPDRSISVATRRVVLAPSSWLDVMASSISQRSSMRFLAGP